MIVDCHTQVWESSAPAGQQQLGPLAAWDRTLPEAVRLLVEASPVDHSIVLGFRSRYLATEISNRFIADYVRQHASRMVGFAGIDPTDPEWPAELHVAHDELRLKGVALSPSMQDFHPCDTRAMRVYDECRRRGLPVVFRHNHANRASKMEFARPVLLDEVAREFPDLRIVITHLGYPWVDETVVLLRKHEHVFAEISGLVDSAWTAYQALLTAHQYGVIDKLLFGSDFPFKSPAACIEALYSINQVSHGSGLPAIPREKLRGIVERDALSLLGIGPPPRTSRPAASIIGDDE